MDKEEFIRKLTVLFHAYKDGSKALGKCGHASDVVLYLGNQFGIKVGIHTSEIDGLNHTFPTIDNEIVDFTLRQFRGHENSNFPFRSLLHKFPYDKGYTSNPYGGSPVENRCSQETLKDAMSRFVLS